MTLEEVKSNISVLYDRASLAWTYSEESRKRLLEECEEILAFIDDLAKRARNDIP